MIKSLKLRFFSPLFRTYSFHTLTLGMFLGLTSCQTAMVAPEGEKIVIEKSGSLETVILLGTNDIHGAFAPEKMRTKDESPVDYEKGGLTLFSTHLKLHRAENGNRLLWLDGGDEFMGSLDSNLDRGQSMVKYYNLMRLDAAAIGNHEFDFGPEPGTDPNDVLGSLKARVSEAKYPYLAANIYDKNGKPNPITGTLNSTVLNAGRLKIGVIGLSTIETPEKTRPQYVHDLVFKDYATVTIKEAKKLREQGADIVVITTHAGLVCDHADKAGRAVSPPLVKSEKTPQSPCDPTGEIPMLIRKLPEGTVDAIVSGHTHTLVHHWINGVPVIQAGTRSAYYNLMYLTYDFDKKKVLTERTRIEGPIPICTKIFANQGNCNGEVPAPAIGRGRLITPEVHGKAITPDAETVNFLEPIFARTKGEKEKVIGQIAKKVEHLKREESPLGNLVADAVRDAVQADVGVVNAGGIRTDLQQGPLTYEALYRAIPFDNFVSLLELNGRQLKRFLRISESGSRGYFPVSGVKLKLIRLDDSPWSDDLDGNRKLDIWEADRLIEARLENGEAIENDKIYKVATLDYLVGGGDYYEWYMGQIPKKKITQIAGPTIRDSVVNYLAKLNRPINSPEHPLVRADSPRLVIMPNPGKRPRAKDAPPARHRRSKKRR